MNFLEALRGALDNLAAHKLRTALTMLGMIFGVAAVIAMLSIGAGGEQKALEAISRLGLHNVIVKAKEIPQETLTEMRKKSLGVSLRDGEAIAEAIPGVEAVLPKVEITPYQVLVPGARTEAKVFGLSHRYPGFAAVELTGGRFFDLRDELDHAQVCVIGDGVRRDLFGGSAALGRLIKINDVWLEVIGILGGEPSAATTGEGFAAESARNDIYLPLTTAMRKFDRDPLEAPVDELLVRLEPGASTREKADLIQPLLERLHAGADDFELLVPEALLEQSRKTQRIFNIVMGSIAGISLLVGGIGIMNIMLASVLERTREIGLRRAIGATRKEIRRQFVIESFAISAIGGTVGITVGVVLAWLVAAYAGWPTVIQVSSLV
ncbi:MAG TPA: ABC transporter permease, partial [Thermoanaerobaculia bacterium]|nr:ABC transporter permease [Thermoanaerobaculia bacterium]